MKAALRSGGDPNLVLVLWELQQTAREAARHLERTTRAAGISTAEFGVLAGTTDDPGITQAQIARQLHIRPQALTATVNKLQRRGLIRGSTEGRGRPSHLTITDQGRTALDAAWPSIVALNEPANLQLTEDAASSLAAQLAQLRENLAMTGPATAPR